MYTYISFINFLYTYISLLKCIITYILIGVLRKSTEAADETRFKIFKSNKSIDFVVKYCLSNKYASINKNM